MSGSQVAKGKARNNFRVSDQIAHSDFPPKAFRQRRGTATGEASSAAGLGPASRRRQREDSLGLQLGGHSRHAQAKTRLVNPQKQPRPARGLKCPQREGGGGAGGPVRPSHWSPGGTDKDPQPAPARGASRRPHAGRRSTRGAESGPGRGERSPRMRAVTRPLQPPPAPRGGTAP